MIKFTRLNFIRPVERFISQWLSVTFEPYSFAKDAIHLGDTTNLFRAGQFFILAVSSAFIAEAMALQLLGVSDIAEPYFWIFMVVVFLPFVPICFLAMRLVDPRPFKDVLHLSLYPWGAGIFTSAFVVLGASAVIWLAIKVDYISHIQFDLGDFNNMEEVLSKYLQDCLRRESLFYEVLWNGLGGAYETLKPPIDYLSYVRPVILVAYLAILASIFAASVKRRRLLIFCTVILAWFTAMAVEYGLAKAYYEPMYAKSECRKNLADKGLKLTAHAAIKDFAKNVYKPQLFDNKSFELKSVSAEKTKIIANFQMKISIDKEDVRFQHALSKMRTGAQKALCATFLRKIDATITENYLSVSGDRLSSYSVTAADCS